MINETFAKRFFAGRHPIGLHVTQEYADQRHTYEVVGVVRDSRQNRLRGRDRAPLLHAGDAAGGVASAAYRSSSVRAATASNVLADVRRVIQQAEPQMPIAPGADA